MSFVTRIFRGPKEPWNIETLSPPWPDDRPSVLSAVRKLTVDQRSEGTLPDEDYVTRPGGPRFIAGLHDRIMLVHDEPAALQRQIERIMGGLWRVASSGAQRDLHQFYEALVENRISDALPTVATLLRQNTAFRADRLERLGQWLIVSAPDRDAVKFGVMLLGVVENPANNQLLLELAGHEEFTELALQAFAGTASDIHQSAFAIAQRTTGWGRVAAVRSLDGSDDPSIQAWLLQHGHSLHVYEPTDVALVCARTGGLAGGLARDELSQDELLAYTALFGDLRWSDEGSDVPFLVQYSEAHLAATRLAWHLRKASTDIRLWERVWLMAESAERDGAPASLSSIKDVLMEFVQRDIWPDIAYSSAASPDPDTRWAAERAIMVF